jgi:hypothetical protein
MSKRELLVIRVITKAIKMRDIEMNLHNNLKDNHSQLEHFKKIYIYIYIIYSQRNFQIYNPSSQY